MAVASFVGALDQPSEIRDGCPVTQETEHQHRAPGQHLERGFELLGDLGARNVDVVEDKERGCRGFARSTDRGQRHRGRGPTRSGIADRPPVRVHVGGDLAGETGLPDLRRARHEQHPPTSAPYHPPRPSEPAHLVLPIHQRRERIQLRRDPALLVLRPFECGADSRRRRTGLTRDRLDDVNGLLEPFERSRSSFHEGDPGVRRLGRADDRPGDQYLSGTGVRTQSSRRVQGNASVPVLDGHGLARVDADPDRQRERGVGLALLGAGGLELDGGTHRL